MTTCAMCDLETMLARAGLCVQQHVIWCWQPADRHDERGIVTMSEQNTESVNYASYWLIETNDPVGTVLYCCGEGDWCSNPNHAMKWGSEEAARTSPTWTQMQYPGNMRIAEHQWLPKLAVWWRPVDELRDKTRKVLLRDGHGHEWVASLDTWSMNGTHPPVEWRPL